MTNTKTTAEETAIQFVRLVTEPFLNHPGDLDLSALALRTESTVTARAHDEDYGRLIGQRAVMLKAISSLVREIGFRTGRRLKFTVLNPTSPARHTVTLFEPRLDWDGSRIEALAQRACSVVLPPPVVVRCEDINPDMSVLRVHSSEPGPPHVVDGIERALGTVFFSVGKGMGRANVLLELTVEPMAFEEPQPSSAAGRFAREV